MSKAIFLDRDGVINKKPLGHTYVSSWEEFMLLPDVSQAVKSAKAAGFKIIVVTNQRGVARGLVSLETVNQIHNRLNEMLKSWGTSIDAFYICPHGFEDRCDCRKPAAGLVLQAATDWEIDISKSWFIGDSESDGQCAKNAGVKFIMMPTDGSLLKSMQEVLGCE